MWNWRAIGESSHTWRSCRESEQPGGTDFSPNSWLYIVLKLPRDPPTMFVFHWSRFILTQYVFSIVPSSHPRIACFPVITLLILSRAGCIYQHLPGTAHVKVIYIYILFIIQRAKGRAIPCPHLWPTRGDNTVSVAEGDTATPGATQQLLPPDRVFKRIIYIYIRQIN